MTHLLVAVAVNSYKLSQFLGQSVNYSMREVETRIRNPRAAAPSQITSGL